MMLFQSLNTFKYFFFKFFIVKINWNKFKVAFLALSNFKGHLIACFVHLLMYFPFYMFTLNCYRTKWLPIIWRRRETAWRLYFQFERLSAQFNLSEYKHGCARWQYYFNSKWLQFVGWWVEIFFFLLKKCAAQFHFQSDETVLNRLEACDDVLDVWHLKPPTIISKL